MDETITVAAVIAEMKEEAKFNTKIYQLLSRNASTLLNLDGNTTSIPEQMGIGAISKFLQKLNGNALVDPMFAREFRNVANRMMSNG